MKKKLIPKTGPKALGAYSPAIFSPPFIFVSGQIPVDPQTDLIVGSAAELTRHIMKNIEAILNEAGAGLENIVRTEIFLTDLQDAPEVNKAYAAFFPDGVFPARQMIQAAALPKGATIEISAIAVLFV